MKLLKAVPIIALFVLLAAGVVAQEGFLDVTASGYVTPSLTVARPVALSGAADGKVAEEMSSVLQFDLGFGPFTVAAGTAEEGKGIREGEFSFQPWAAAGAKLLLKSGYQITGDRVVAEFRLYDVLREKLVTAKRYSGSRKELRKIAHTFSDEVMRSATGEAGPFTCKLVFVSPRSGSKEVYLMDYDGHNVQRLTSNGSINLTPEFYPNGREIVYTSYKRGKPDLYRREIYSGVEARISAHPGLNTAGIVSPQGDRIALTLSKDGNSEIYVMSSDGKQLTRLTNNGAIDVSPTWSPDGKQLAFVSDRLGKPYIFIMNADGTNQRRLTYSGNYNVSPRWSPKGDRIVYVSRQGGFQIHTIRTDGSGDVQLTTEGNNEHPHWSPDGRFIAFSSKRSGGDGIYIMRSDGSAPTKVSRGSAGDIHPAWSPRG